MKKNILLIGTAIVASLFMTNCAKEIDNPIERPEETKVGTFELIATPLETKTENDGLATKWVADDGINVFHAEANSSEYVSDGKFTISADDLASNKFKGEVTGKLTADAYDWYMFYPYGQNIKTPANSSDGYTIVGSQSNNTQIQDGNNSTAHLAGVGASGTYPLYGVIKGVSASTVPTVSVNQVCSFIEVSVINNSENDLIVESLEFTAPEDIVGTFYIDFSKPDAVGFTSTSTDSKTYTIPNAKLTVNNGSAIATGSKASFYLGFKPFTVSSGTLKVSVNGYEKEITISKETAFSAGKIKKINFNYDKEDEVYELIETDGAFVDGGKYVFAIKGGQTSDNTYYFISNAGSSNNLKASALTISDNKITNPDAAYVFTAVTNGTGFSLQNSNGNYINGSAAAINTDNGTGRCYVPSFLSASKCYKLTDKDASRSIRYYSATAIRGYADNSTNQGFVDQITEKAALTSQRSGAWYVFKLGGLVVSVDPTISDGSVDNVSARGSENLTKEIVLTNYDTAPSLTATPDGTVVTSASVSDITASGTIVTYTVAPNYSGAAKQGTINVSDGTVSGTITVNQVADVFTISRTELELGAASGSTTTITVKSDYDWTVVDDLIDGFTVSPASFTYNGTQSQTVTITATGANTKESAVELGIFTIKRSGDNKETATITVSQKSAKLATPSLTISKDATNKKFTISWGEVANASKYEYYVMDGNGDDKVATTQTDDATTLSFEVTNINLGETYTVTVKAIGDNNPWIDSAEAEEDVKVEAGNKETTITFNGGAGSNETITWTSDAITCVAAKASGSNNPNEHAKDAELRLMAKNTLTFSGATIKKITFNFKTAKTLSASPGTYNTDTKVWEGSATEVVFTNTETAQAKITSVTIEYAQ